MIDYLKRAMDQEREEAEQEAGKLDRLLRHRSAVPSSGAGEETDEGEYILPEERREEVSARPDRERVSARLDGERITARLDRKKTDAGLDRKRADAGLDRESVSAGPDRERKNAGSDRERTSVWLDRMGESLLLDRAVKRSLEPERTAEGKTPHGEEAEEGRRRWERGEETGLFLQLRRAGRSARFFREERRDSSVIRNEEIREKTGWSVEDVDRAAERDSRRYDSPLPLY